MANPFFANIPVPPESFIGRTSEIAAAFDTIDARSHLAIWEARNGENFLLRQNCLSPNLGRIWTRFISSLRKKETVKDSLYL